MISFFADLEQMLTVPLISGGTANARSKGKQIGRQLGSLISLSLSGHY